MQCPNCRAENPEARKFCRECGARLLQVCHRCGSENLPGDKFCGECGHSMKEPEAVPSIDYSQPQSYTPKFLVDKILTTRSSIEGERKLVTVLFADVANYTSISEKLDPEEVHQIMNGCFKILMDEIHKYEGTINQFTGDGVMALFGAPLAHEDHARRACHAALGIQRALQVYGERIKKDCGVDFKMRVGLNSGPVIVGAIGDDLRLDYTAVGDITNLAARLESMAKPGTILVSRHTHKMAGYFFEFSSLGKLKVKGKEEPLDAYQLLKTGKIETSIEASIAKGLTKFVGRQREIEDLKEAFEKAKSGSGQIAGLVGEAGLGKSRLIIELREMLAKDEYTYLEGRCLPYGGSMAYLPILDILRSYFDIKQGEREFIIKKKMAGKVLQLDEGLKEILPQLHEILSLTAEDEAYLKLEPHQKRERTFEAIRDLLILESEKKPLILTIEDFHWIDKTSEEFLTYLIGWLANTHILLILLYRPERTHRWGSKSYYSQIGLNQLSTGISAELLQSIMEEGEAVPELRDFIFSRTGGNPLFMEEVTRTLLENGSIQKNDHQYLLSGNASEIQVPDTIQGIIMARMDRLGDNLKRMMQAASVIGRDFASPILQTITGLGDEIKSYLFTLQELEFIYEKRLFPELEYIFKHAIMQEVAYNSLLLKRRKEIHEKIGMAIEELYPDRLEEFYEMLAYHYSKSENLEKGYQYLKLSGSKATQNYALWEAFRFYKKAIKILQSMPDTEENKRRQIEVRTIMEGPMSILGYPEDSLQILQDGERLSKELGDEKGLATFYSRIGYFYTIKAGNPLPGIFHAESSFKEAQKIEDVDLMARIVCDLCSSYYTAGDFLKIVDIAPQVLDLLEKTHREHEFFGKGYNVYSVLYACYGYSMGFLGNIEEGKALCEKGLRFSLEIKDLYSMGWIELLYGFVFNIEGDGKNAIEHLQNSIRYLEKGQFILILGTAWAGLGWGYYFLREFETALKHVKKGLQIQKDAGTPFLLSLNYCLLSMISFDLGDLNNAQRYIEEALKLSQKNNEKHIEGLSKALLGRILKKRGSIQSEKAGKMIMQGIQILDKQKIKPFYSRCYFYLGELYAETGPKEKALGSLKKAKVMFQEMGMDHWIARTQRVLERLKSGAFSR